MKFHKKEHNSGMSESSKLNTRFIQKIINVSFLLLMVGLLSSFFSNSVENIESEASRTSAMGIDPFVGEIAIFPFNFAPQGWARCDGQLLAIAQNTALFSLIGTTFGGDGETTFGLPDLRGRVIIHHGQGPGLPNYILGQKAGAPTHTLTAAEMPVHSHTVAPLAKNGGGDDSNPGPNRFPATATTDLYADASNTNMGAATSSNTGGGQAHNNMQPYLTVGYYIALSGVYPSE